MERVGLALELVDFLTLKCTSALEKSMNSLSPKFLYQPHPAGPGWDVGFYRAIGLETQLENDAARSRARLQYPGDTLGTGVTAAAARELGLAPGTAVATSLIDADAGNSVVSSATRATRRRDRRKTERPCGVQWVRAWCSSAVPASARCGRRPVADWRSVGLIFITISYSVYNAYYIAVMQKMEQCSICKIMYLCNVAYVAVDCERDVF